MTTEHAFIVLVMMWCLIAVVLCLPLAVRIHRQNRCPHNSVLTEMPRMQVYRDLFSGKLSIDEYRKVKIPPDKRTCLNCGKDLP